MSTRPIKNLLCGLMLSLIAQSSLANLLINPTRVYFSPTDRTADVTLINISQATTTYRVEWAEKKAKPNGGYDDLSATEALPFPTASKMLRVSPKQVTLKPGERQTIKMALRRPQNLANGEYRSHLLFKALPPSGEHKQAPGSTVIAIVMSFAVPVVVSQGADQYSLTFNNAILNYNPAQKTGSVDVSLSRTGSTSTYGDINAYWTPAGGTERLIAKIGDYNFWPELSSNTVSLTWTGADFALSDGKLRIEYEGVKNFRGKTFFNKTLNINRSMIKTAN